ncbi:MAG: hydrogenase maturation protease [Pirellulales bacterium]|nr:hydrogenase maturation protease [Pirellulales bacterium]
MKTLVLGLGNPLIADDSVGLRVIEVLRSRLDGRDDIVVDEDYWGGLRLMERMIGFDKAVVVDAICTGAAPGTIHRLTPDAIPTQRSNSAHDVTLPTALALGRKAEAYLPRDEDIRLIGVEAEDILNFSEQCTPAVQAAIPDAVEAVLDEIEALTGARPGPKEKETP